MSPVRVTWNRTIGRARSLFSTAFAAGGFLAASAALFAFRLDAAEGVPLFGFDDADARQLARATSCRPGG